MSSKEQTAKTINLNAPIAENLPALNVIDLGMKAASATTCNKANSNASLSLKTSVSVPIRLVVCILKKMKAVLTCFAKDVNTVSVGVA